MKRCPRCQKLLPLSAFGVRTNGRPQHWCRTCHCAYQRAYFQKRRDYYLDLQEQRVQRNRQMLRQAKSVPCADCGQKYPFYVMDFDHRPEGKKEFNLSNVATQTRISKERLLAEIAKCDVVCANCHRERTWQRRQKAKEMQHG